MVDSGACFSSGEAALVRRPFQRLDLSHEHCGLGIMAGTFKPSAGQIEQRATVSLVFDVECKLQLSASLR
jgi:hypothetical protein